MDINQAVDHLAFAPAHRRHVRRHGPGPLPVFRPAPDEVGDLAAVDHVLAWQARDIGARPTDQSALDDNGPAAPPSKFPSNVLAGLAATEDDVLDLFIVSHDSLQKLQIAAAILRWRVIEGGALTKLPRIGSNCSHAKDCRRPEAHMTNKEKDQPRRADEVIEYWAALYPLLGA
jgi:hypothetical protein